MLDKALPTELRMAPWVRRHTAFGVAGRHRSGTAKGHRGRHLRLPAAARSQAPHQTAAIARCSTRSTSLAASDACILIGMTVRSFPVDLPGVSIMLMVMVGNR